MAKEQAKAICILGMHRSGTSMITRAVNLLGAYLGEECEVPWADSYNPTGYWEHEPINEFHERLLAMLERAWDTALPLPSDWHVSSDIRPFREELIELVDSRFSGRPLWAWKDPRTTILLPLWKDVLARLEVELCCLLVSRNPLDVARSLKDRNGFSIEEGLGIWFNYNLAMLRESAGLPRALVSYQQYLENPELSISTWARQLKLPWPPRNKELRKAVRQAARSDLCHSASTLRDLTRNRCPKPVVDLARLLNAIAKSGDIENSNHQATMHRLRETHISFSKLYEHDFVRTKVLNNELNSRLVENKSLLQKANAQSQEDARKLHDLAQKIAEKQDELENVDVQLRLAEQQQQTREREIREQRESVSARDRKLGELGAQQALIERQLQEREGELRKEQDLIAVRETELHETRVQRDKVERLLQMRGGELQDAQDLIVLRDKQLAEAGAERENTEGRLRAREVELGEAQNLIAARDADVANCVARREEIEQRLHVFEGKVAELRELITVRETELAEAGARREAIERQLQDRQRELGNERKLVAECRMELREAAARREAIQRDLRASALKVDEARQELANKETEFGEARHQYKRMTATYSWRITRPLRKGYRGVMAAKQAFAALLRKILRRSD